jgi:hypothetical protein
MGRPDRVALLLLLATGALLLGWAAFARLGAPALIERAYRGESIGLVNRMISGQAAHPVGEYLDDWRRLARRVELGLLIGGLLIVALARPEVRRALDVATAVTAAGGDGVTWRAVTAALGLWLAGAFLVQGDLFFRFARGIWGADHDGAHNLWVLSWGLHALTTAPTRLFDANIFHPARDAFALSELRLADQLVFAPARALSGSPIVAFNVTLVCQLVFTSLGVAWLARHLVGGWRGAVLAGTMFGLSPTRLVHLDQSQLLSAGWTPLAVLFLDRFLDSRAWRDVLACAACVVLQCLASFYLGYFLAITMLAWLGARVAADPRGVVRLDTLLKGAVALALAGSIVIPLAWPYLRVRAEYGALGMPRDFLERASAEGIVSYLAARPRSVLYGSLLMPPQPGLAWEKWLFPGFLCLGLAILALAVTARRADGARRRVWSLWALVTVGFVLSQGPTLHVGGGSVPSPYRLLGYALPGFDSMRVPARLGIVVAFALSLAAAAGYRWIDGRLAPRLRAGAFLVAFALVLAESAFTPARVPALPAPDEIPEEYRWLAANARGAVLELPIRTTVGEGPTRFEEVRRETRYMYASLSHWRPLVNGYTSYRPRPVEEVRERVRALPAAESFGYLQAIGVRHVLVHRDERWHAEARSAAAAVPGSVVTSFPSGTVLLTLPDTAIGDRVGVSVVAPGRSPPGEALIAVRFENPDRDHYWVNRGQRACRATVTWAGAGGAELGAQRVRVLPPVALAPGEGRERTIIVRVPDQPGPLRLSMAMSCGEAPNTWSASSAATVISTPP